MITESFDSNLIPGSPIRLALRSREAAEALGISERLLWTLTQGNKIPHARISKGIVVYPVDQLRRWLETSTSDSQPSASENS